MNPTYAAQPLRDGGFGISVLDYKARCDILAPYNPAHSKAAAQVLKGDLGCAVVFRILRPRRLRMVDVTVNGQKHQVDVDPDTPLLWVLRDTIGLTGTKYGCGIAQCGACTVHMDGMAVRSCSVPISLAGGKQITTIEGLAQNGTLHKVQKAWIEHDVPQCGYCQSGMIMAVAALLKDKPKPTDEDINREITNICRCGTYQQVREAIHAAANA